MGGGILQRYASAAPQQLRLGRLEEAPASGLATMLSTAASEANDFDPEATLSARGGRGGGGGGGGGG
jgi:hypothetical protein